MLKINKLIYYFIFGVVMLIRKIYIFKNDKEKYVYLM